MVAFFQLLHNMACFGSRSAIALAILSPFLSVGDFVPLFTRAASRHATNSVLKPDTRYPFNVKKNTCVIACSHVAMSLPKFHMPWVLYSTDPAQMLMVCSKLACSNPHNSFMMLWTSVWNLAQCCKFSSWTSMCITSNCFRKKGWLIAVQLPCQLCTYAKWPLMLLPYCKHSWKKKS